MIRLTMLVLSLLSTKVSAFRPMGTLGRTAPRQRLGVSVESFLAYCRSPSTSNTRLFSSSNHKAKPEGSTAQPSTTAGNNTAATTTTPVPLLRSEGLFAVNKPLEWTSQDAVAFIRGILERDARNRGAKPVKVNSRRNKDRIVRVGHGGTLDPLATGVLVIGVGKGTKELQSYLKGAKGYRAGGELGFETTTLDMEGDVTKKAPVEHVTRADIEAVLPELTGTIQQIPPIFSAIRKDGKRLYEEARGGKSADDVKIEPRQVEVLSLDLVDCNLPKFDLDIKCGGGTYVRSLIRDIGYKVDSVATTTYLERTQQGQFKLADTLAKEDWTAGNIYAAIDKLNAEREEEGGE